MVNNSRLKDFIKFAARELNLKTLPHIKFVGSEEDAKQTFGHQKGGDISVRITNRHPVDVMRTIAHELVHIKQGGKGSDQYKEDNANAIAGRIMRKYATLYPQAFKDKPISEEGEGIGSPSVLPNNHTGPNIATFDPLMIKMKMIKRSFEKKPLTAILGKRARLRDLKKARVADPFFPK